jgi:hypothetical protein
MPDEPRKGGGKGGPSEIEVTPEQLDIFTTVWTDGTQNVTVEIRTKQAIYKFRFGELRFLEFTVRCLEKVVELQREKRKGS